MIDQGFLKSHFVGRDGFIWWIGQVAPKETWKNNFSGKETVNSADIEGFGERYRVRIMGYHTANKDDLPDDELPFATVMYPVTGGAGGDAATSSNIRQGNFVFGFFLDGEEAQQPVIMGLIGYNNYQEVMDKVPSIGFKPFYGLDGKKPGGGRLQTTQTGGLNTLTTQNVSGATDSSASSGDAEIGLDAPKNANNDTSNHVTGVEGHKGLVRKKSVAEANDPGERLTKSLPNASANDLPIKGIQKALQKAIQEIENLKKTIRTIGSEQIETLNNIENEINAKIDVAASAVASGIKWIYQMVEEHVLKNLDLIMKKVFSLAKPSEQEKVSLASTTIMNTIACFFRKLFGGLLGMVRDFIAETVDKVVNVPTCFVEKFAGNVLGTLSGSLSSAMDGITGLISGAVDLAGQGLDIAGDIMGMVSNILSFLNCDEFPDESPVSEWSHIYGSGSQFGKGDVVNILNKAKSFASSAKQQGLDALDTFDFAKDTNFSKLFDAQSQLDGCITDEFPCGPPDLNIFGSSQGSGAVGNLIINAAGSVIGVDMQSFGVGYDDQTRVNVLDQCGRGRGAVLRPVFGNVNNAFAVPILNSSGPSNSGTPALAPDSLGFGPFAPNPYPFDNNVPGSTRISPYNPSGQSFGTPSYGLGPSFSKLGKRAPKTQLGISTADYSVNFAIETFTIPVAETKSRPVIKFVLQNKTQLENIDTDFDFSTDDISGSGRLENGQVVVGVGTEKFTLAPKSVIDQNGLELKFQEAFIGGQKQRVVEDETYLVRGFQFDGEPLINPIQISNDGKCAKIDAVENVIITTIEKKIEINTSSEKNITFNFTHDDARDGNAIEIPQLGIRSAKKGGSSRYKFKPESVNTTVETGVVYEVRFITQNSAFLRSKNRGRRIECNDNSDNDWLDAIIEMSEGKFYDLQDGGTGGNPKNVATCKFTFNRTTSFKTVYEDIKSGGDSDEDYDDLVICAEKGKFKLPKSEKLRSEGAVLYVFEKEAPPSPDTPPVAPTPISTPGVPVIPIPDYSVVTPGPTIGGIPGILTPGPSVNSTFHPFPGSTTLGPGKWVPGPIPPGGGGPHIGPAVFIHDGELFGELISKQGSTLPTVGPVGSFAPNTGGGGGVGNPGGFDPGSIGDPSDPGGFGGGGDDPGGLAPSDILIPLSGGGGPPGYPTLPRNGGGRGITPVDVKPGDPGGPGSGPGRIPDALDFPGGGFGPGTGGGGGPGDGGPGPGDPGNPIGPLTSLPPGPGTYYPDQATGYGPIVGIPVAPGVMVPANLGGITGPGIGIVDIIVEDGGTGYLPGPDGSTGGDGRTYSSSTDTRITYSDGVKEIPIEPDNRICVDEGDTVILPIGTEVITETFDGEGGGELIIGGAPHVMQKPGCFTTPKGGQKPPIDGTYPVLMYLCDVIIKKPGFGYLNTDRVIINPNSGAEAELVVDKFGRITDVLITKPGEGFQEIPTITIESSTGQDADLLAKLCIDRVSDITLVDQEKVIQVVDCVGKF